MKRVYHVCSLVADLDAAMEELTRAMGVRWQSVRKRIVVVRTANGRAELSMRLVYSAGAGMRLELLEPGEGTEDTPWELPSSPAGMPGPYHHIGMWVDDLEGEASRLERAGMVREASDWNSDGPSANFVFMRSSSGMRFELVSAHLRQLVLEDGLSEPCMWTQDTGT